MKRDGYLENPLNLIKAVLAICIFILYLADDSTCGITPPRMVYGGWKPILPGHPFYFGTREGDNNNVPSYADTNAHPYIHTGPVRYIEQVIHPTKYALLPEKVLRSAKHISKDIFSYYPRSTQGSDLPPHQGIDYKPIYIELPRKPLDVYENPTTQNPPFHQSPHQHVQLPMQKSKHPQDGRLYEQTFIKITPLVDTNGQSINPQNVQIRPYLVPLPPSSSLGLSPQNSISLSMDKLLHQAVHQQNQQHGGDRPYLPEMPYIRQNQISVGREPIRFQEQVMDLPMDIPQHMMEQPMYQNVIERPYSSHAMKPNLDNNYLSIHQDQILPERHPQPQLRFPDPVKHQFTQFEDQPVIYHVDNHNNKFKKEHEPMIHYHHQNRYPQSDLLLSTKYQYKVHGDQEPRHQNIILDHHHQEQYNPLQSINDLNHNIHDLSRLRIHQEQRSPPRLIYKEVVTPKPPMYHIHPTPKYVDKEMAFKKPHMEADDLSIIHIPLAEYLRLKAQENLFKKETLIVTSGSKPDAVSHRPNDYETQYSNKNLQYKINQDQSNEVASYSDPYTPVGKYNATSSKLGNGGQAENNDAEDLTDQNVFHAYYAPADHDPPEGYVKMTIKEFDQMFKNAEIRYVDKEPNTKAVSKTGSNANMT